MVVLKLVLLDPNFALLALTYLLDNTVKPVLATSIKHATGITQTFIQFPEQTNTLQRTCIKQTPVLSKQILIVP